MRIESPLVSQTLIESPKSIDKKDVTSVSNKIEDPMDGSSSFIPSSLVSSGTYSVASLRSAVDYNAKYMTVAESNIEAAKSMTAIPKAILSYFNN